MRLSLAFTGFGSILANLPAVRAADEVGLDGVWYAEHIGNRDAVVPATVFLRETEHLELALMGVCSAGRHPGVAAMELASLAEIAPGRVRAAVGTGVPDMIAKLGKSVGTVRDTIALHQSMRTALAGGDLTVRHTDFEFSQFKMNPVSAPPPLDIMAIRPRMVDAAIRYADGLCLSAGASLQYLTRTVGHVETALAEHGRSREEFRVTAVVAAFVTDDVSRACNQVAALLSTFHAPTTEYLAGGAIPAGALESAIAEGGPFGAVSVFTSDVVDAIALVCPPDGLADKLRRYADTGVDEVAVTLFGPPEQLPDQVRALAAGRPTSPNRS